MRVVVPAVAVDLVTGLTEAERAATEDRVAALRDEDIRADEVRVLATPVPARLVLLTRVPSPETTPRPAGWVALRVVQVLLRPYQPS